MGKLRDYFEENKGNKAVVIGLGVFVSFLIVGAILNSVL